ncbi:MAG: beta-galactosidase [Phycisphaerae bacterium]
MSLHKNTFVALAMFSALAFSQQVNTCSIDVSAPQPIAKEAPLEQGTCVNPAGDSITADSVSLFYNGVPWVPVAGEFHYSRYPQAEWRGELAKMKAGGIDIVSTYVFWIHHEENQGEFVWSGDKDLRKFVQLCDELGMKSIVRLGPWCHGEVRNGGLPDWVQHSGARLRTKDPAFMGMVEPFYREIAAQISGLLWKDGGPVIGVQLDNERNDVPYLLALKQLAIDSGIDVPLYTMTGWNRVNIPEKGLLPLFGSYSVAFWYSHSNHSFKKSFFFSDVRDDGDMGAQFENKRPYRVDTMMQFPFVCCEIGGGMPSSYTKRIKVMPDEIASMALVRLGCGNNMPGYYMYHGGKNPLGKTNLNEESPNPMPIKDYDFQAPLGAFGQVREHYHLLRLQHLFVSDFGDKLARMPLYLPETRPESLDDVTTLRWSARSDGESGFVFFNNYQPVFPLPEKESVQFEVNTAGAAVTFPASPIAIPSGAYGIMPLNMDCSGAVLEYATVQPVCKYELEDGSQAYFFAEIKGITPELAFRAEQRDVLSSGEKKANGEITRVSKINCGEEIAAQITAKDGKTVYFFVLSNAQAKGLYRLPFMGKERIILSQSNITPNDGKLILQADSADKLSASVFPAPDKAGAQFARFNAIKTDSLGSDVKISVEKISEAGEDAFKLRGTDESVWGQAQVWKLNIPHDTNPERLILNISYNGDAARLYVDGEFYDDNYYNGDEFATGLWRIAREDWDNLTLKVLPFSEGLENRLPAFAKEKIADAKAAGTLGEVSVRAERLAEGVLSARLDITAFGAVADDKTINTKAIQAAIDKAAEIKGTVIVPEGVFISGALFMKPGANLHLEKGAVLRCSLNVPENFPAQRTRIEGHFEDSFTPALINADRCDGMVISGEGTLDGAGRPLWDEFWRRRNSGEKGFVNLTIPRARLSLIENSNNVTVKGITYKDSQFWNLHIYNCDDVLVDGVSFKVPDDYRQAPSTDGIDLDSCRNVTVRDCYFSVTDDCIAMKGTKGPFALEDKTSPPVYGIRVSGCNFRRGHSAMTCGSEATSVSDVIAEDCVINGAMPALRLKLRPDTPQHYRDITIRNITYNNDSATILMIAPWTQYFDPQGQPQPSSRVNDIIISGISGNLGSFGRIQGHSGTVISGITFRDSDVKMSSSELDVRAGDCLNIENVQVNGAPLTLASRPRPAIFIAGDSTASNGSENGWGSHLQKFFDKSKLTVFNRARGGRSSRTFTTEGLWERIERDLKPGDTVLIQFGHNDAGAINDDSRARGTMASLGDETIEIDNMLTGKHEVVKTFGAYLRDMIAGARAKGAEPVLMSMTARNVWRDGQIERENQYCALSEQLAEQEGVKFIDLRNIIADQYQMLTPVRVLELFPKDHTHTGPTGAYINASLVVAGLKSIDNDKMKYLSRMGAEVDAYEPPMMARSVEKFMTESWMPDAQPALDQALPTLYIIGDSTVRNGSKGDGSNGEWGWGAPIADFLDRTGINVQNCALGGTSSRTYRTNGIWGKVLKKLRPRDIVIMQFGHNDSSPVNDDSRARGTLSGCGDESEQIVNLLTGKPETVYTYGHYLREYIREARAKGAEAIVCSPVPRSNWKDGHLERKPDSYPAWAGEAAAKEGASFIDLNEKVSAVYDELGHDAVCRLFFASGERTHTNAAGAQKNAECLINAIKEASDCPLKPYIKEIKPQ